MPSTQVGFSSEECRTDDCQGSSDDLKDRILRLQTLLSKKPKNARAMAQLACLLFSKATSHDKAHNDASKPSLNDSASVKLMDEARMWVDLSVATAPTKPFGYAALSMVHGDLEQRMQALRIAIDKCSDTTDSFNVAALGLLVRLLVEPRDLVNREQTSRSSNRLNAPEESTVCRIENLLSKLWSSDTVVDSPGRREFVALREFRLGRFFRKLEPKQECRTRSIHYFQVALQHLPAHHAYIPLAQFWLATLGQGDGVNKCPAEYVIDLYSTFAPRFDALLVNKLDYQTPSILRQLHDQVLPQNAGNRGYYRRIADLGCGTGLSGLAFSSLLLTKDGVTIGQMTGVDLSLEMLALSAKRGCYNNLLPGDIQIVLTKADVWDLVLACDVFCYIGDLENVFGMVRNTLINGGIFIFSTEMLDGSTSAAYHLHECARFAHNPTYIETLAIQHEFQVLAKKFCPIRKNQGKDVMGLLMIFRK
jgi:predicted TPR repeat methyltransferase